MSSPANGDVIDFSGAGGHQLIRTCMQLNDVSVCVQSQLNWRRVEDLEQAWSTAQSILNGRELVGDVSGLTGADGFGVELLPVQCARAKVLRYTGSRIIP